MIFAHLDFSMMGMLSTTAAMLILFGQLWIPRVLAIFKKKCCTDGKHTHEHEHKN